VSLQRNVATLKRLELLAHVLFVAILLENVLERDARRIKRDVHSEDQRDVPPVTLVVSGGEKPPRLHN